MQALHNPMLGGVGGLGGCTTQPYDTLCRDGKKYIYGHVTLYT